MQKVLQITDHELGGKATMYARWHRDFLANRTRQVRVEGCDSVTRRLRVGAPQGTAGGGLIFAAYAADLMKTLRERFPKVHVQAYCDDTVILLKLNTGGATRYG
jgi:hypothetical protein